MASLANIRKSDVIVRLDGIMASIYKQFVHQGVMLEENGMIVKEHNQNKMVEIKKFLSESYVLGRYLPK